MDLCFVPVNHQVDVKLPAVSGSSGHLVVERLKEPDQEPEYPGRVFADPELDYVDAMQAFVQSSRPLFGPRQEAAPSQQTELQQVRQAEDQLRLERRHLRKRCEREDAAWRVTWSQPGYPKPSAQEKLQPKPPARWGTRKVQEEHRRDLRRQHRQQWQQRQQEDQQWRLHRKSLREQIHWLPMTPAWIAILMITDNCTRQCLGLPLFVAGAHVTAEMVVSALRVLVTCPFAVPDFRSWHTLYGECISAVSQGDRICPCGHRSSSPSVQWNCRAFCPYPQGVVSGQGLAIGHAIIGIPAPVFVGIQ